MREPKLLLFALGLAAAYPQPGLSIVEMTEKEYQHERSMKQWFKSMPHPAPVPVPAEVLEQGKMQREALWRATVNHSPEIQLKLKKLLPGERAPFFELPTTQYKILFGRVASSIPERMADRISHEVFLQIEQDSNAKQAAQTTISQDEQEALYRLLRITYNYLNTNYIFYTAEYIRLYRVKNKLEKLKSEIKASENLDGKKILVEESMKIQRYIEEHEKTKSRHRLQLVDLAGEAAVNNFNNQLVDFVKIVPDYLCR